MRLLFPTCRIDEWPTFSFGLLVRCLLPVLLLSTLFQMSAAAEDAPAVPMRMTQIHAISFGKIIPGQLLMGRVVIDPGTGERSVQGDAGALSGSYGPALFEITGTPNASFFIELPQSLELTPGVVLTDFKSFPTLVGHLDAAGKATLQIGATLVLNAAVTPGSFSTSFDVSIGYQ